MEDPLALTSMLSRGGTQSPLDLKHHKEVIKDSGIARKVADDRGYTTVSDAGQLIAEGYSAKIARKVVPGLLIPLYSPSGARVGSTFKPDNPRIDERKGSPIKYEKPRGSHNVVDCHPSMTAQASDPEVDLWITEGNKKADAAVSRGLCCLALAGVDNWLFKPSKDEESQPCTEWDEVTLRDRRVYIVFDSDQATNRNVQRARRSLTDFLVARGVREVLWVDLPHGEEGDKVGLDDYFVSGGTVEALRKLSHSPSEKERAKPTQGKEVIDYVRDHYDLFATPQGQAFAVPRTGLRRPIPFPESGGQLTSDVRLRIHEDTGKALGKSTVSDAMGIVHALALLSPQRCELHIRCAYTPGQVVIDLGEPNSTRCLVVTGEGWQVAEEPPSGVYFRRSGTTLPLPVPQRDRRPGVGWQALAAILGWEPDAREFLLTRSWIACAPLADLQRPMLLLVGAPGSGKTTRGLTIIGVWDPREGLGSSLGRNLEDDRVKANSSFLIGYDNLSTISEAQSDHLARVVTGDAPDKRQLYSDDTIHAMYYRRTGVLTAINLPKGIKPDSYERFIPVELNRIRDFGSENQLARRVHEAHPAILSDALDDLVRILSRLPVLQEKEPPGHDRMKDYWLALRALGKKYAKEFAAHSREGMQELARNDPWVQSVVAWVTSLPDQAFVGSPDEGYASYSEFTFQQWGNAEMLNRLPEARRPTSASALSRAMASNATPLRAAGVEAVFTRSNGKRKWVITCTAS
ncbi:DUF3854 domain-containing protein [Nocardioides marmotae]|uniref:DUF3854 domain-containing protein n=1 Tax=Nocardioides marmotae TaxID=2663857 RepID=UPI0012B50A85|nr:DUF3854 domain-containing protein [Nocardioides marmotae]MBC9734491.1 DUF3854 domain-containing protein [Nocardioides marmotae]MTB85591.1 DUF3854 domain-containing protein [Nocardioides marmotae]